jgi:hypothetical protein
MLVDPNRLGNARPVKWVPKPPVPARDMNLEHFRSVMKAHAEGNFRKLQVIDSPSDDRKFAFVHVPKTGGSTISKLIGIPPRHATIRTLPPDTSKGVFTFAVARDPWDRLVSAFYFLTSDRTESGYGVKSRKTLTQFKRDFRKFVREFATDPDKYFKFAHFRLQLHWITNAEGNLAVTKLCRYESFETEVRPVLEGLGYEWRELTVNKGDRPTVAEAYDKVTADRAGELYRGDVELLGYHPPTL